LLAISLWLIAMAVPAVVAQDEAQEERLLKAAFIYNFAKFTRWPAGALSVEDTTLNLCVVGEDSLVAELVLLGGKMVRGHPISIKSVKDRQNQGNCHILYIAVSEQQRFAKIVESVRGEPVLTVSELPHFGREGGIIELFREDDRIRFLINLGVARESGLVLSSRLLSLAVVIGQEKTP
jgi:hypothetical protein